MAALSRARATLALPLFLALAVAGCGQPPQGSGMPAMPPAEVTAIKVEPKTLPATFEYVGQTTGSKEVEVRARVTGILEQKLFQEGGPVKAGQALFVIDPRTLAAQTASLEAEVNRAQAQKAWAEREAERLKPLAERKAVGQKESDDAISNAQMKQAELRAAEAKLAEAKISLGYTRVTAPITGLTSRAAKSEGSLVTANETLLTVISQVDPMWIPFSISENEQLSLNRAVSEGRLTLPKDNAYDVVVQLADGSTLDRKGRINFSDTRINPATGTFEMRAEIANRDGLLKPGQFVRVRLQGARRNNAIAVPQVAVLDGAQGKFVYVVEKDKDGKDVAAVRPITLGQWVSEGGQNLWVVDSGLKPADTVIVDGVAKLRPGAPVHVAGTPGAAPAAPPPKSAAKT